MGRRSISFAVNEFYHVYNRGVDKRNIFEDKYDLFRFLKALSVLNTEKPIGSIFEHSFKENKENNMNTQLGGRASKLVEIICFCLNPNHYHLLLEQKAENGIPLFMQRLGTSYTMYFNEKYERSGPLFGGRFKAVHVTSNSQLLHLSAYINLNFEVHNKWEGAEDPLTYSSWPEYCDERKSKMCQKGIILDQFSDTEEYKRFALNSLQDIKIRRGRGENTSDIHLE